MNLKEMYGKRYRISMDESYAAEKDPEARKEIWRYYEIRGKYGMVFPYGWNKPAVTFTSNKVSNKTSKDRNWQILQNGEDEQTYLVPKEDLEYVIESINPRKKRQISETERLASIERLKKWAIKPGSNIPVGRAK